MSESRDDRDQGLTNIRDAVGGVCAPLGATFEDNANQVSKFDDVLFRIEAADGRRLEVNFYLVDIQDSHEHIVPRRAAQAIKDLATELKRSRGGRVDVRDSEVE